MKQSLISKKRWQPTLDSAKQTRDEGDFEQCYHYLRELLHSLDNQNRTGINLNDEQTTMRDEAKRLAYAKKLAKKALKITHFLRQLAG